MLMLMLLAVLTQPRDATHAQLELCRLPVVVPMAIQPFIARAAPSPGGAFHHSTIHSSRCAVSRWCLWPFSSKRRQILSHS